MTSKEYDEMWQDFVTSTKVGTIDMIERMHNLLFYNGKPTYGSLDRMGFKLLLSDLECMFHAGVTAGVTDALRALRNEG